MIMDAGIHSNRTDNISKILGDDLRFRTINSSFSVAIIITLVWLYHCC